MWAILSQPHRVHHLWSESSWSSVLEETCGWLCTWPQSARHKDVCVCYVIPLLLPCSGDIWKHRVSNSSSLGWDGQTLVVTRFKMISVLEDILNFDLQYLEFWFAINYVSYQYCFSIAWCWIIRTKPLPEQVWPVSATMMSFGYNGSAGDHFVYLPSQWETTLQCKVVSDWLGTYTKWSVANIL